MRPTLLLSIVLSIFLATSVGTASATQELDEAEPIFLDLPDGDERDEEIITLNLPFEVKNPSSGECNGIVDTNCVCPSGQGSATCRDGHSCTLYVWAVWPECIVG